MKKLAVKIILISVICILITSQNSFAASPEKQKQIEWFKNAKFGMFIHWGVYSMVGYHEWARDWLQIPLGDYQYYVDNFNPVAFNPDDWVDLALEAGMKYLVITSKHHDGFCIFDSRLTEYDIMHSHYSKDALKMLSESCRKKGFMFGFYYSIMDWHHPDYIPRRPWEKDRPENNADLNKYIQYMKGQLQELIEHYNPAILWFDGAWEHTREELHSAEVEDLIMGLKPDLLFNDRLHSRVKGEREKGDFGTPENYVPATGIKNLDGSDRIWEACYTMGYNSWGYNPYETEFHSTAELIRMIIETVSKGGNLLLNVGPTPEGTIPPEFAERLKGIGRWMKINRESIYGTTASCFDKLPFFGRCTVKGNMLYLHVMGWPQNHILKIPGLKTAIKNVYLLAEPGKSLPFEKKENDYYITLPERAPDNIASVIAVRLSGAPEVEQYDIKPDKNGSITLPVYMAELKKHYGQKRAYIDHVYDTALLVNWKNTGDYPEWNFITSRDNQYEVTLSYNTPRWSSGCRFKVAIDEQELPGKFKERTTGSRYIPSAHSIGRIHLSPGKHTVKIEIIDIKNNESMKLEKVVLIPVK